MKKILIFGGKSSVILLEKAIDYSKVELIGFINNDTNLIGKDIIGKKVYSLKEAVNLYFDFIIIGSMTYTNEMLKQLKDLEIPNKKVVIPQFLNRNSAGDHIYESMNQYEKEMAVFQEEFAQKNRDYSVVFMNRQLESPKVNFYNYPDYSLKGVDFVRLNTIELLSREIKGNNVKGAIAELGVYRGDLSRFLSDIFSERELILFDTFDGFDKRDVLIEQEDNLSNAIENRFNDTSESIVLNKINRNSKVEIVKGYFPESTINLEDKKYAFVSIDVDLYNPIFTGLEYFYERLEVGGYIIVHDYNFPYYSGVKKAVQEFSEKTGIYSVPICDHHGSTIFVKNRVQNISKG